MIDLIPFFETAFAALSAMATDTPHVTNSSRMRSWPVTRRIASSATSRTLSLG